MISDVGIDIEHRPGRSFLLLLQCPRPSVPFGFSLEHEFDCDRLALIQFSHKLVLQERQVDQEWDSIGTVVDIPSQRRGRKGDGDVSPAEVGWLIAYCGIPAVGSVTNH